MRILTRFSKALAKLKMKLQHDYEEANTVARANAQAAVIQNNWLCYGNEYKTYLQFLIDCVSNTYTRLGLNRPGSLLQHMAPYNSAISLDTCRGLIYRYVFDRGVDVNAGSMIQNLQNHTIPLTTNSPTQMAHQINQVLPNYCICNGCVPVCIDRAYDTDGGRVCFEIVAMQDGIPL